jgi:hypothetical protein
MFRVYTINGAHMQYGLLDTILNYIFQRGPPGKPPRKVMETYYYMSAGFAGRHVVGLGDLSIGISGAPK